MSQFQGDAIFWIEVEKIRPNPYQPRMHFDEARLNDLADSIKQYGVLQPLTVTRVEEMTEDGGMTTSYELIAGERRWRAARLAGVTQVPALIRNGEDEARVKLELAIIENLQREDLNPIDRATAFERLATEFGFSHTQIAKKVGRSREYVSNSLRILALPDYLKHSLERGEITEGHTRPLLMLNDRPKEQEVLYKEIVYKKMTVRDAEQIARRFAQDKVRKKVHLIDPEISEMENELAESLGTRVQIDKREQGGKITIDFFSHDDLRMILSVFKGNEKRGVLTMLERHIAQGEATGKMGVGEQVPIDTPIHDIHAPIAYTDEHPTMIPADVPPSPRSPLPQEPPRTDKADETPPQSSDDDLYSVRNFSI